MSKSGSKKPTGLKSRDGVFVLDGTGNYETDTSDLMDIVSKMFHIGVEQEGKIITLNEQLTRMQTESNIALEKYRALKLEAKKLADENYVLKGALVEKHKDRVIVNCMDSKSLAECSKLIGETLSKEFTVLTQGEALMDEADRALQIPVPLEVLS